MKKKHYNLLLVCSLCFIMAIFTGCTFSFNSDDKQETSETINTAPENDAATGIDDTASTSNDASDNTADTNSNDNSAETTSSDICGKYVYTYTDEIEGQEVSTEFGYIFNEDHTGFAFAQDILMFTWDDKQIHTNNDSLDYEIKGDVLTFKDDENKQEYTKKKETDAILNGDFSEYAGFYKPTDKSNKDYGEGDKIVNLEIHEDGSITGGYPVNGDSLIKQVKPSFIVKEANGGYTCYFGDKDSVSDFNQGKYLSYTVYPETSVPEYLSKESNASNKAHVSLRKMDGKVYTPNFYFESKDSPK